jgi:hypothetical protein
VAEPYSVRRVGDAWVIFGNGRPILATRNRRDAIQCAKRAAELASEASSQRGDSIVRAHSASEDIRAETASAREDGRLRPYVFAG